MINRCNDDTYYPSSAPSSVEGKRMENLMQALHDLRKTLYQLTDDISEVMAEISSLKGEHERDTERD